MKHRDSTYFLNFICLTCSTAMAGIFAGTALVRDVLTDSGDWDKAIIALVAATFFQNIKIQMDMHRNG